MNQRLTNTHQNQASQEVSVAPQDEEGVIGLRQAEPVKTTVARTVRQREMHSITLDATNLISANIEPLETSLCFNFKFADPTPTRPENTGHLSFYLGRKEAAFLVSEDKPDFWPWLDDLGQAARFSTDGLEIIPTHAGMESQLVRAKVKIRIEEALEVLKKGIATPKGERNLDILGDIKHSAEMAVPNITEDFSDRAKEILADPFNQEKGILGLLEHIRTIARNRGRGQDDPVTISLHGDGERDLYFDISRKDEAGRYRRIMNGGISWSESSQSYSANS